MKNKIKNSILFLLTLFCLIACQNEDIVPMQVDAIVAEPGDLLNQSFPLKKVRVEGQSLAGLKQIILDNKIDVSFNPTYNSDKSFIFTIPFDVKKGSRFGKQTITFITASGSVTKDFEILQPLPTISGLTPETPLVGKTAEVTGDWFYDVSSVTFKGNPIGFTVSSPTSLFINIPASATSAGDLVITTPSGSVTRFMEVSLGFTIVNVTDFDGGGTRPGSGWFSYGDVASFNAATTGGPTGNYAQYSWTGATTNGYNGCSGGEGATFFAANPSYTDATKAYIDIDVSANVANAHFAIQLNTIDGKDYGYNFKVATTDWATKSILIADFKDNYGYGGNATGTDLDVSKIKEIKIAIVQGDTPNPTIIKFDNIKIKYKI
ncbi:hypothetical protein AB3G33_06470 [Flavobacterium sp. WC2421]|uniref:hypothetical protein n=1 Tax=Flavobacterium sp. WC2421 TaxID=3234138 RepID=UPI00346682E2